MSQSLSVLLLFISFFKIVLPSSVNQDEKVNIITDKPKYFLHRTSPEHRTEHKVMTETSQS